jgi:hypothetical protein
LGIVGGIKAGTLFNPKGIGHLGTISFTPYVPLKTGGLLTGGQAGSLNRCMAISSSNDMSESILII